MAPTDTVSTSSSGEYVMPNSGSGADTLDTQIPQVFGQYVSALVRALLPTGWVHAQVEHVSHSSKQFGSPPLVGGGVEPSVLVGTFVGERVAGTEAGALGGSASACSIRLGVWSGISCRRPGTDCMISEFLTSHGVASLNFERYSAATPDTAGHAIEVPLIVLAADAPPTHEERMSLPGAKMSTHDP